MLAPITTLAPHGFLTSAPPEGLAPVVGPVVALEFILGLAGPVPNVILPAVPQSCQNSCPNVALQVLIIDQDGNVIDLSTASGLQFWLLEPGGPAIPVPASFVSNGMDGMIQFITNAGTLPVAGLWGIQAQLQFGISLLLSRWGYFAVESNVVDA